MNCLLRTASITCLLATSLVAAEPETSVSALSLVPQALPDLPDPIGFGGPIVGVHDDVLIVAGGANFPGDPPWSVEGRPPGMKIWYDRVYCLRAETSADGKALPLAWHESTRLPRPLGYAATVSTARGVYVLGGETWEAPAPGGAATNHPVAEVLLLRWDRQSESVEVVRDALPSLPRPSQYHAAAAIGDVLYVVASHGSRPDSMRLDSKSFWSLDLTQPRAEQAWLELPTWPGSPREKMAFVPQQTGRGIALFLIGGSTWAKHPDGTPNDARAEHFADGYRYDPATSTWTRIADLPRLAETRTIDTSRYRWVAAENHWVKRSAGDTAGAGDSPFAGAAAEQAPRPLGAAPALERGNRFVLLFSGATGRYVTMDAPDRPLFPRDVVAYDTRADRWTRAGELPLGVVTTTAATWRGLVVIPSGETQPGIRTPRVQALKVEAK